MAGFGSEGAVERRVKEVVSALDATLSADETIARAVVDDVSLVGSLPVISIDTSAVDGSPRAREPHAGTHPDLEVLTQIGAGGMGAVYAARQRALDRDVAVKRPLGADASSGVRAALLGEARIMGSLEHPNIVPVHALGLDRAGLPLLVMKRIEGVSFRDLLHSDDPATWTKVGGSHERGLAFHVEVLAHVANALAFAHSRGVVHRDVKPENVMIGRFGEVYLLDWGIARRLGETTESQVVGTPSYMAPEMLVDPASADERTDVYLLGATLHEVLVGEPPHKGADLAAVFSSILVPEPIEYPASVPGDLADLSRACLALERDRRPPSAQAFRDALLAYRDHQASHDLATSAAEKLAEVERSLAAGEVRRDSTETGILLAESRFGFEQSLRQWSENASARAGLERCLALSIERELDLRNPVTARALLAAMSRASATMVGRIESLEREIEAAKARNDATEARARDLDASVSAIPRIAFTAGFLVIGTTLSVLMYREEQRTGQSATMEQQLGLDFAMLGFFVVGMLVARKRLLANAYNRNLWAMWGITVLSITICDYFLMTVGLDAGQATTIDFLVFGTVFACGGLLLAPHLGWVALSAFVAAGVAAAEPSLATPAATMALVVSLTVSILHDRKRVQP